MSRSAPSTTSGRVLSWSSGRRIAPLAGERFALGADGGRAPTGAHSFPVPPHWAPFEGEIYSGAACGQNERGVVNTERLYPRGGDQECASCAIKDVRRTTRVPGSDGAIS